MTGGSIHADLVVAGLGDVADPRQSLVAAALDHLQVPHLGKRNQEAKGQIGSELGWGVQ